jgi:hypothetical protein
MTPPSSAFMKLALLLLGMLLLLAPAGACAVGLILLARHTQTPLVPESVSIPESCCLLRLHALARCRHARSAEY